MEITGIKNSNNKKELQSLLFNDHLYSQSNPGNTSLICLINELKPGVLVILLSYTLVSRAITVWIQTYLAHMPHCLYTLTSQICKIVTKSPKLSI